MPEGRIRSIDYGMYDLSDFGLVHITYPDWDKKEMDADLTKSQRQILLGNWLSLVRACMKYKVPVMVKLCRSGQDDTNPLEDYPDVRDYVKFYVGYVSEPHKMKLPQNICQSSELTVLAGGLHLGLKDDRYDDISNIDFCVGYDIRLIRDNLKNSRVVVDPNISVRSDGKYEKLYVIEHGAKRFQEVSYEAVYKRNDKNRKEAMRTKLK